MWLSIAEHVPPRDGRSLLMTDGHGIQVCYPKSTPRPLSEIDSSELGKCSEHDFSPITAKPGDRWEYFRDYKNAPGQSWSMIPTHWQKLPELP